MEEAGTVELRLNLDYTARPIFLPYHFRERRFSAGVAHRRAGKTIAHLIGLFDVAAKVGEERDHPPVRCAYVAPTHAHAKAVAWNHLKHYLTVPPVQMKFSETELYAEFPVSGARITLYGAENAHRMRGLYFDHVVLDEYGQMAPSVWPEIIRPTLSDYNGKASFIGTPNGRNHFWELFDQAGRDPENWFRFELKASETGIIPQAELDAARKDMTPEQYDQEYECSFQAGVLGAYYSRELALAETQQRIGRVPWQPQFPVTTAWDLGIGDSTAIWFAQWAGKELHLIDYLEHAGVGLDWYAQRLRERPYVYGDALLPHDAKAKELGTGRTRVEALQSLGVRCRVLPQMSVADGINAARLALASCWFDTERCRRGIEALRQYRCEWDEKRRAFNDRPLHDWTSNAADAFRYLAMGTKPAERPRARRESTGHWMG